MKTLYIIRHAKSSWEFDLEDKKRPLNPRGLLDAELVGKELKTLVKTLDLILSSPAVRAYSTAKIINKYLDMPENLFIVKEELYDFDGSKVIETVKKCEDTINSLMIFGHNHAFTSIANNYGSEAIDNLPTCGVVVIEFDCDKWEQINVGKTLHVIRPKFLK